MNIDSNDLYDALASEFGEGVTVQQIDVESGEAAYTCIDNTYCPEDEEISKIQGFDDDPLSEHSQRNGQLIDAFVDCVDELDVARSFAWSESTHMVKVTQLGTGDMEVVAIEKLQEPEPYINRKKRETVSRENMSKASLMASAHRSKRRFVHNVMQIQADVMLTGTTRGAITDRDEFDSIVARFTKAFKKKFPNVHYAMTAELHTGDRNKSGTDGANLGGYHWHMAANFGNKFIAYGTLHKLWRQAITGNPFNTEYAKEDVPGNIHVRKNRVGPRNSSVWATSKLARYCGKYVAKDIMSMTDMRVNKKRYWATKGVPKPAVARLFVTVSEEDLPLFVDRLINRLSGRPVHRCSDIRCSAMVGFYSSTY